MINKLPDNSVFPPTNKRPPKETSEATKTRLLKLASPFRVDIPATYKREFSETSPPTNSLAFADISFATVPPVKVEPPPPPVNATPPIMSELFDGINRRPPKDTSLPTKTLLLKLASPFRVDVPVTDKVPSEIIPVTAVIVVNALIVVVVSIDPADKVDNGAVIPPLTVIPLLAVIIPAAVIPLLAKISPVTLIAPVNSDAPFTKRRPPKETSEDTKTLLLKDASPFKMDVPATYKREFSEVSPLAKSRPFRLMSSETMSW